MTEDKPSTAEQERRRFFRIDDEVGLVLTPVAASEEEAAIATHQGNINRVGLLNELRGMRYEHLPQQRSLESKFPTVASYIRILERQLDILARAIDGQDDFPNEPNTTANISAQGLSLITDTVFTMDSMVSVKLALFPDHCRIEALGRVVRGETTSSKADVAIEFTHLREADREALIRHIYLLQRQRLQARYEDD
ncbi:type IV pilus assembly PilZ [Thiorhodococcus drewsii AZ1]|uniref:Type IV pilus assembly PilZ n=1 Tax=Thiorhodococcus drewsii AZ1 TaxID=765913 RepID=G2E1N9_9GAMM|nr:PilZ domain-containing protein [Thiorhodococcus drewsii]EGV31097.1 type IV pilus assembly PilZ [Thiorhodococcus drewsii AZ1]